MQQTRTQIITPSGSIVPIGPGQFIEKYVPRINHPRIITGYADDGANLDLTETGSFTDEDCLRFHKRTVKMKEIYDSELLHSAPENRAYINMALTHFGLQELQKIAKGKKDSIKPIDGDMTIQDIEDLALEFMKENGSDGHLILLKNIVLIAEASDFELHLGEVYKTYKRSNMMCGALFCPRPHKVVKATFTGRIRFT